MDITITINVKVPDDGAPPTVTINNQEASTPQPVTYNTGINLDDPAQLDRLAQEIWEKFQTVTRSRDLAEQFPNIGIAPEPPVIEKKPRKQRAPLELDLPEKACGMCGQMFKPTVTRQKYCGKKCKDNFYRKFEAERRMAKAVAAVEPKHTQPFVTKQPTPRKVPATPHVTDVTISKDDFYQQQLKKAAKKSPTYNKYLSAKDLTDLETA